VLDTLSGLEAAHALTDEDGNPMNLVHRDVSPHNVLVGVDGSARLTDFGVARAESRISTTRPGQIKGKLAFMSPEQIRCQEIDRRADIFSVGCMLWSALTGRRLFLGANDAETMSNILKADIVPPSSVGLVPPDAFDAICLKALERDRDNRWASAGEMEQALREAANKAGLLGTRNEVADWVTSAFGDDLKARRAAVRSLTGTRAERSSLMLDSGPSSTGPTPPTQSGLLQKIPAVGPSRNEFDVDISAFTPSNAHMSPVHAALATPKRAIGLLAGIIGGALVAGIVGAWLVVRTASPAAQGSSPPVSAPAASPVAPPVGTAPPQTVTAQATPPPQQAAAAVAPVVAASPSPQVVRPAQPAWRPPPAAGHKPGAPAAAAPPIRPENAPAKPQTAWDKDSPLPPQ
jgi:serine/threonine-protein kinase